MLLAQQKQVGERAEEGVTNPACVSTSPTALGEEEGLFPSDLCNFLVWSSLKQTPRHSISPRRHSVTIHTAHFPNWHWVSGLWNEWSATQQHRSCLVNFYQSFCPWIFLQKSLVFQQSTNTVYISLSKNLKDTVWWMVHLELGYHHVRVPDVWGWRQVSRWSVCNANLRTRVQIPSTRRSQAGRSASCL